MSPRPLHPPTGTRRKAPAFKPLLPTEHQEQTRLFQEAALRAKQQPEWALLFAIPNAGGYTGGFKQNVGRVQAMKAEGVRSGVPDLLLPIPRGGLHGLFIELKRQKDGSVSPEQRDWLAALSLQGYRATVCAGCDAAIREIEAYLSLKPDEVCSLLRQAIKQPEAFA